jgi:hypothetical protein
VPLSEPRSRSRRAPPEISREACRRETVGSWRGTSQREERPTTRGRPGARGKTCVPVVATSFKPKVTSRQDRPPADKLRYYSERSSSSLYGKGNVREGGPERAPRRVQGGMPEARPGLKQEPALCYLLPRPQDRGAFV